MAFQLETVNNAIVKALTFKRWRINSQDEEAGVILAQIAVRDKHFASIEITYTTTNFSIKRLETKGLGYRPAKNYHRNYNKFVPSDPLAIINNTEAFYLLEDGDFAFAEITKNRPDTGSIHRNYNNWVMLLEQQIYAELSTPGLE